MMWQHYIGSILMILVAIYVAVGAIQLGIGTVSRPSSGFIFLWLVWR
jgi:hypothetical protein